MKNKSSIKNYIYELNGQKCMFGRDNLLFKTVNMPSKQRFDNICPGFKLKKFIKRTNLSLSIIAL